jgi:hypothetical protein
VPIERAGSTLAAHGPSLHEETCGYAGGGKTYPSWHERASRVVRTLFPKTATMRDVLAVVWVTAWQMECCGEPFAVGDRVSWSVRNDPDVEWLTAALGADVGTTVTHAEEHHTDDGEDLPRLEGRVVTIKRAWGRFEPVNPGDSIHCPASGSERFLDVRESDGIERHAFSELSFNGWVVELDLEA